MINYLLSTTILLGLSNIDLTAQSRDAQNNQAGIQQNEPKRTNKRATRKLNSERANQNVAPANTTQTPQRGNESPGRTNVQPVTNTDRNVSTTQQPTASQTQAAADLIRQLEEQSKPVVQDVTNGQVNWTKQYVEATGQAIIDNERFKNPAQARLMAQRGAVVVAQRNLLEIIKGVHVTGETTVEDMATSFDYIYTRVDGVIKGAEQVGQAVEKDGFMEVRMRVPLSGTKSLADAVVDGARTMNAANARVATPGIAGNVADMIDGSKPLVFNIAGQQISPSMFPRILDEAGNLGIDLSAIYNSAGNGNLPKYIQASEDVIKKISEGNVADVIELVTGKNGMLQVSPNNKRKINWGRIANIASTVGRFIMML
ncbi:MAG: LPP20 family lipoprotein [Flavobacteriales bacterium]